MADASHTTTCGAPHEMRQRLWQPGQYRCPICWVVPGQRCGYDMIIKAQPIYPRWVFGEPKDA